MCQINMNPMNEDDIETIKKICLKERKYGPGSWIGGTKIPLGQNLFDIIVMTK